MDADVSRLIQAIHQSRFKTVLALTGGGTSAAGLLLRVPGGSRTVLEVCVPYDAQAFIEYLGRRPEQFCSPEVAREMAIRAASAHNGSPQGNGPSASAAPPAWPLIAPSGESTASTSPRNPPVNAIVTH